MGDSSNSERIANSFRGVPAEECERMKDRALERNIFVKFMIEKMKEVSSNLFEDLAFPIGDVQASTWLA